MNNTANTQSKGLLERLFNMSKHNTNLRIEFLAGLTTFLTMSYIIIVNPMVLGVTGMDKGAIMIATCITAAVGCFIMGFMANLPIALAPAMGLNAYFAYSVVLGQGVPWQVALAAIFCSGILFILLSLFKVREALVNAMPMTLKMSITAGIGLLLALISMKGVGIIEGNKETIVSIGKLFNYQVGFTLLGFLIIVALDFYRVRGAMLIGILAITVLSAVTGYSEFHGVVGAIPSLAPTFGQLNFSALFDVNMFIVIFVFLIVDLFDSTGTLVGTAHRAGLLVDGKLPRLKQALFADSAAIVVGAVLGTSSTTPYIESTSGVSAGGRTGLTAIFVGLFMLISVFFAPLVSSVPVYATAPALIYVGVLMMQSLIHID